MEKDVLFPIKSIKRFDSIDSFDLLIHSFIHSVGLFCVRSARGATGGQSVRLRFPRDFATLPKVEFFLHFALTTGEYSR